MSRFLWLLALLATSFATAASLETDNRQRAAEFLANRNYLTNGLTDPRFHVEGAQVTLDDVTLFIEAFPSTFDEALNWKNEFLKAGATEYSGRLKKADSLLIKMHGRFSQGFTLDAVNDVVGVRAIVANLKAQNNLVAWVYQRLRIEAHMDYVTQLSKADGYRAHNITLRASTGRLVELQILTVNQMAFASFTHDRIYKSDDETLKNDAEITAYLKALSEALYLRDQGVEAVLPTPPQSLINRGLTFSCPSADK
jgi:ppGpp synthetase/RelA/SpoT-type nucleotidyltranferase